MTISNEGNRKLAHSKIGLIKPCFLALCVLSLSACVSTTRTLDPNVETHVDASYDFSDKKQIVDALTESLLSSPRISTESDKPIVVVYGVNNAVSYTHLTLPTTPYV